jgi:uncharacterized protein YndB with AHSA1/START domain
MDDAALPGIERSVWLPAGIDRVWEHITDGELLELWFGGKASITPRPGGRIELDAGDGPLRWGTVEDIVERSRIQWSWRTGDGDPSLVVIELLEEDDGVRLVVSETLLEYRMEYHPARHELGLRWAG